MNIESFELKKKGLLTEFKYLPIYHEKKSIKTFDF